VRKWLVILLLIFFGVALAYSYYSTVHIEHKGRIICVNVIAYRDENCTEIATELDWGGIWRGENKSVLLWIKNTGNWPGDLTLNTTNWNPEGIEQYIDVTYELDKTRLEPGETTPLLITLAVHEDTPLNHTSFAFDTVIILTGDEYSPSIGT